MTEKDLQNLNWRDISILRNPDNSLLIVLLFDTQASADKAALDVLSKNRFSFNVSRKPAGTYNFELSFLETGWVVRYESKYTRESYLPVTWIGEGVPTFLTTGHKTPDGKIMRLAAMLRVDNLLID